MAVSFSKSSFVRDIELGSEEIPLTAANFKLIKSIDISSYCSRHSHNPLKRIIKLSKDKLLLSNGESLLVLTTSGRVEQSLDEQYLEGIASSSTGRCIGIRRNNLIPFYATNIDTKNKNGFSLDSSTPVYKTIHDIAMLDDYIILTSTDGSTMIKLLKGSPKHCKNKSVFIVESDRTMEERESDSRDRYISAVKEKGTGVIYVSDTARFDTDQITKLSLDGEVLKVYNDWDFTNAGPIAATGDGHLFVCFQYENCIQLLTPQMDRGVTVLDESDGIVSPSAICYCPEEKKLYVWNKEEFKILVFAIN